MADAQHLPQGRRRAGDRHLKFYETRDNLQVVEIRIEAGLPFTLFGQVLAHEMTHGWLARFGTHREPAEEEGICELVGSWWLEDRGGPFAERLRTAMEANPDPVYGGGFRACARSSRGMTRRDVVDLIESRGRLTY